MPSPNVNTGHTTYIAPSSVTNHVVNAPSHEEGDAIYIAIVVDGVQALTPPSGFSGVSFNINASNNTAQLGIYRKVAGGSEPSTYTVQCSSAERAAAIVWSQSDDNDIDVNDDDDGNSASANCPGVTTTEDDTLILRVVGTDSTTLSHGTISGHTKLTEVERSSGGTVSVQYKTQASAGASGAGIVSLGASQEWRGVTLAIKGVSAGGGFQPAWAANVNKLIGAM